MILSIIITYSVSSTSLTMFILFSVYVNTSDGSLTPRKVFVAFSLVTFIRIYFFELAGSVLRMSVAFVSMNRIRVRNNIIYYDYVIFCRIF